MPRPTDVVPSARDRNKQRRRERILDAAAELLRHNAHDSITLEQIARGAQVAEMTIFNLIGNRAQIWAALAERCLAETVGVEAIDSGDPYEQAMAVADAITRVLLDERHVFRAVLRTWTSTARVMLADPTTALRACFAAAVRREVVVADLDTHAAAELLSAALLGVAHEWAADAISDDVMMTRARDMVSIAFAAGRPNGPPEQLRIRCHPPM
jgi:AcrR family transcriptional regulator